MDEYAPPDELKQRVWKLSTAATPSGPLEQELWTMSLPHLAWFAGATDWTGKTAQRILEVRVAAESAEQIRKTNRSLVWATWALVAVTAALVVATIIISSLDV